MKTYFFVTDIHSMYDELMQALKNKGFDLNNEDHILVVCGDILDRGSKGREVIEFIESLLSKDRVVGYRES